MSEGTTIEAERALRARLEEEDREERHMKAAYHEYQGQMEYERAAETRKHR